MWDYAVAADEDAAAAEEDGRPHDTAYQGGSPGADSEPLSSKLQPFLASLRKSRGFYANLAESLCSDESFAETRDTADCWNGQRVGEYSRTVVAASPAAQKYNPELRWQPARPDPRVAELSDQLRRLKQVLVGQLTEAPRALSLVRYVEGSGGGGGGGGREPPGGWDGEPEDGWRHEGSGSGSGQQPAVVGGDTMSTDNTVYPSSEEDGDKRGAGASSKRGPAGTLTFVCSALLTSRIVYVANM